MGILSSKNNPDKWKNKYFNLLDDNEVLENSHQLTEKLLTKTIIRLCLATTGLNKQLDPHLIRIRKQLKKGLKNEQLKQELENFSNTLMTIDEIVPEDPSADASLLFDFLLQHFPDQKKDIQHIEAKYEKKGYANPQYLIVAINDLIDSIQHINPIIESVADINQLSVDSESISKHIEQLLEETEIPAKFEIQTEALKQKIKDREISLTKVLDETISLLFQIKKHLLSEQQEIALFLGQLTEQLTELGIKASGVKTSSENNTKRQSLLDASVTSQMLDLQTSSKKATQLEPLKLLIHSRLQDIAQQIQEQHAQGEIERSKANQELDFLSAKIIAMELESSQLASKLESAYQQATHDPLTGLPNRLAYEERLSIESAQWKRYQTPLSLLIWDIDLFKQINDTFGHKAGDKTLILIAKLLSHHCRETDFVSRFGGEEFTMLLSNTDAQSALESANNIRTIIERTAFNYNGKKISITISCGITQLMASDDEDSCFNRADKALYMAKNNGRNQCTVL